MFLKYQTIYIFSFFRCFFIFQFWGNFWAWKPTLPSLKLLKLSPSRVGYRAAKCRSFIFRVGHRARVMPCLTLPMNTPSMHKHKNCTKIGTYAWKRVFMHENQKVWVHPKNEHQMSSYCTRMIYRVWATHS